MAEIKTPLKHCPDYDADGSEAWIIEPKHTWSDVMRHIYDDIGSDIILLAKAIVFDAEDDDA